MEIEGKNKLEVNNIDSVTNSDDLIIVNDCVIIQNGLIIGNPFYSKLTSNSTVEWIVKHKNEVRKSIIFWLNQYKFLKSGIDIDDCFDYILNYFLENPEKEFKEKFFGEDSDYTIKEYIKLYIRLCVMNYIRIYIKEMQYRVNVKTENEHYLENNILYTSIDTSDSSQELKEYDSVISDKYQQFLEYDNLFESILKHENYFYDKGYVKFDILSYFAYMYFDVDDSIKNSHTNSEMIENQILNTSKKTNTSKELLEMITNELKTDFNRRNREAKKILAIIYSLMEAVNEIGWKPEIIRNEINKKENNLKKGIEELWLVE